ncbi:MAG: hypothetical protein SCAL_000796 [Candidatus Syntrophoarchaeum caldarius]|uniref:Uncharacterized protein n=1 Tax=Candidatus Syntropharchaeum caldarium TaxID=1838285 RepID=A0A1F2PBY9_9EURY|nr:MAG: hypothetical protein SCAL_000796 [Candidatus Syntrophoarchaeum caldarius]
MNNWLCIYEDKKKIFPSQITEDEVYPYRVKVMRGVGGRGKLLKSFNSIHTIW